MTNRAISYENKILRKKDNFDSIILTLQFSAIRKAWSKK